jgi:hypothetical protein
MIAMRLNPLNVKKLFIVADRLSSDTLEKGTHHGTTRPGILQALEDEVLDKNREQACFGRTGHRNRLSNNS